MLPTPTPLESQAPPATRALIFPSDVRLRVRKTHARHGTVAACALCNPYSCHSSSSTASTHARGFRARERHESAHHFREGGSNNAKLTTRAALRERLDHFRGKRKLDGADAETGLDVGRLVLHSCISKLSSVAPVASAVRLPYGAFGQPFPAVGALVRIAELGAEALLKKRFVAHVASAVRVPLFPFTERFRAAGALVRIAELGAFACLISLVVATPAKTCSAGRALATTGCARPGCCELVVRFLYRVHDRVRVAVFHALCAHAVPLLKHRSLSEHFSDQRPKGPASVCGRVDPRGDTVTDELRRNATHTPHVLRLATDHARVTSRGIVRHGARRPRHNEQRSKRTRRDVKHETTGQRRKLTTGDKTGRVTARVTRRRWKTQTTKRTTGTGRGRQGRGHAAPRARYDTVRVPGARNHA